VTLLERRAERKREATERLRRFHDARREAIKKDATICVASESAESTMGAIPPGKPRVERRLKPGDHVLLHADRNRALVVGSTTRLTPVIVRAAPCGLIVAMFGAFLIWMGADLLGLVIALAGAVFAAVAGAFEFRKKARFEVNGRLLTGEVTNVEEGYSRVPAYPPGVTVQSYQLRIFYRFLTPTGEERAGSAGFTTTGCPVPSPGDHLAILYADGMKERVM